MKITAIIPSLGLLAMIGVAMLLVHQSDKQIDEYVEIVADQMEHTPAPSTHSPGFQKHYRNGKGPIYFPEIFNDIFTQIDSLKARVAELEEAQ